MYLNGMDWNEMNWKMGIGEEDAVRTKEQIHVSK
jgi:hypothetical protein